MHTTHTVPIGGLKISIIVNIPKNNDYTTTYSDTKLRIKDEVSKFLFYGQSTNGNVLLQRDDVVLLERVTHMYLVEFNAFILYPCT